MIALKSPKSIKTFALFGAVVVIILASLLSRSGNRPEAVLSGLGVEKAQTIRDACLSGQNTMKSKENCYADEFKKLGETDGPQASFAVLEELQKIDRDAVGCHLLAHGIGIGSYKKEPSAWRELIQNMRSDCSYGAIHGVLESYIASLPSKSLSREVIPTICGREPRADCNHIIGHLLLVQTDALIPKALDLCEVFEDGLQNEYCISGVFMEYQTAINLISHDLAPESWLNWPARVEELEQVCRKQKISKHAEGCWEEIVHAALVKFNNDPKTIFDFCSTAQVPEGAKKCKRHSIGIIGASRNFNLESLKYMCGIPQKDDSNFEAECYPMLVSSALSTVPGMTKEAEAFCRSLEKEFQNSCFGMIEAIRNHNAPFRSND